MTQPSGLKASNTTFSELGSRLCLNLSRACLLTVVVVAPWLFGGMQPMAEGALYSGVLAALVCLIVAVLLDRRQRTVSLVQPPLLYLLFAALILGALQILPHGLLPGARSVHPAATRLELSRLLLAVVTVVLGAQLFQRRAPQRWLWGTLALNGAALAFFGIVQKLRWNGQLFWTQPLEAGGGPFASFVNRNNAAGYLNLCLAGALGLVFWQFFRETQSRHRASRPVYPVQGMSRWLPRLTAGQLAAVLLTTLIAAGVLCSLSRGGVVALVGGLLAMGAVVAASTRLRVVCVSLLVLPLLSLALVNWVDLTPQVKTRLLTLCESTVLEDGRIAHWGDALDTAQAGPVTGSGLGTYRYAYLPHQKHDSGVWFHHAENQYLESLVEGGVVGLLLLSGCVALVLRGALWLARRTTERHLATLGYIGAFAIASQGIHACFDFGLFLPANMLLFALLSGVIAGNAALARVGSHYYSLQKITASPAAQGLLLPRLVGVPLMGLLLVSGWLGLREVHAAGSAQLACRSAADVLVADSAELIADSTTREEVDHHITALQRELKRRPDDADVLRILGYLWICRYRLSAFEMLAQTPSAAKWDDAERWRLTSTQTLHQRVHQLWRLRQQAGLDWIESQPQIRDNLRPGVVCFQAARRACPYDSAVGLELAALSFLSDKGLQGEAALLEAAVRVDPARADVLYRAGRLALDAGFDEDGYGYWRRCLQVSAQYERIILSAVLQRLPAERVVEELLPADPQRLLHLARSRASDQKIKDLRPLLVERAGRLLSEPRWDIPEGELHYLRAIVHVEREESAEAIAEYREALLSKPEESAWRLELARLLLETGQVREAHTHLRLCASVARNQIEVKKLLRQIYRTQLGQRGPS